MSSRGLLAVVLLASLTACAAVVRTADPPDHDAAADAFVLDTMSAPDLPVRDAAPADGADAGVDAVVVDAGPLRLLSPLSTATATTRRPTFRWALAGGADGAEIEWCRDRACTLLIERTAVRGTTAR